MITPTPYDPSWAYKHATPTNGWAGFFAHPVQAILIIAVLIGVIIFILIICGNDRPPSGVSRGRYQGDRRYPFQAWLDDEK